MSIINDALKKARRQASETPGSEPLSQPPENESEPLKPRTRSGATQNSRKHFAGLLLVVLFLALVGALGYFVYTEFLAEPEPPEPTLTQPATPQPPAEQPSVTTAGEEAATPPEEEAPPTQPNPNDGIRISPNEDKTVASQTVPTAEVSAPESATEEKKEAASTPIRLAPASVLGQFRINGVMRGSSGDRVLSSSGVYGIGDTLASPTGYSIIGIDDKQVILSGPDGVRYSVPLP